MIRDWLQGARCKGNAKQFELLELVADRVAVELGLMTPAESMRPDGQEPLRYLLHGPPGTGKSHAVKLLQDLFDLVGFKKGIDWEFLAFQATNAADLDGDTIHHACGFNTNPHSFEQVMNPEKAKRMAYWRFVFIDEISLVPANLLAQFEQRVRQVKPRADEWKHTPSGEERAFGGINLLAIGDFKQLPPPQGGYLAGIPHRQWVGPHDTSKAPDAMVEAGQRLMWEDFQGMIALNERERCKDNWWNEVTDELRAGRLSDKNYNYLHGIPVEGCQLSPEERASRRRVITGPDDPRLQVPKFQEAPLIVANNDSKYQINKDRARKYARDAGATLRWASAKDIASGEALQAQICDKDRKIKHLGWIKKIEVTNVLRRIVTKRNHVHITNLPFCCFSQTAFSSCRWLQYHDKDTGNLMGMLPLAIGMPIALTEHIDRAEDKLLLRGKRGIVHSWLWPEGQPRPSIVYVKFEGAEWQLEGLEEPGLYPVVPKTKSWYLDKGRKVKTLKVVRTQLPLAPAFSMTAHSSQGKTLRAVLLDLHVDKRVNPTIGTVATTRVRSREDVLILRPFPKFLFQRGMVSEGPDLLLQKLAGQDVNWAAVREAHRPCAACRECQQIMPMDAYMHEQWELVRANKAGMCRTCKNSTPPKQKRKLDAVSLQKYECMSCNTNKIAEAFPRAQLAQEDAASLRECLKCLQAKRSDMLCCRCMQQKPLMGFEPEMVTMPLTGVLCKACQEEMRQQNRRLHPGFFTCQPCSKMFPAAVGKGKDRGRQCLNCASRGSWEKGVQTCRSKDCKRKFSEPPTVDGKRQRYCPECRRH